MTKLYILFMSKQELGGMGKCVEGKERKVKMKEGGKGNGRKEGRMDGWMDEQIRNSLLNQYWL